ncbi:conserved hypothetical protein [Ricinus communis]|uniref:Uncharacterized protein n=1 Tax=Ricinus communis TaxID=3988 RepID=B9S0P4_RICCO|nr:conserved hypothetical protein [Ricinus communis]
MWPGNSIPIALAMKGGQAQILCNVVPNFEWVGSVEGRMTAYVDYAGASKITANSSYRRRNSKMRKRNIWMSAS